jgi:hypothetical protein
VGIDCCQHHSHFFSDVDECAAGTHTCNVNAVCSNTVGGFNCTCKPGYAGDGFKCLGG